MADILYQSRCDNTWKWENTLTNSIEMCSSVILRTIMLKFPRMFVSKVNTYGPPCIVPMFIHTSGMNNLQRHCCQRFRYVDCAAPYFRFAYYVFFYLEKSTWKTCVYCLARKLLWYAATIHQWSVVTQMIYHLKFEQKYKLSETCVWSRLSVSNNGMWPGHVHLVMMCCHLNPNKYHMIKSRSWHCFLKMKLNMLCAIVNPGTSLNRKRFGRKNNML